MSELVDEFAKRDDEEESGEDGDFSAGEERAPLKGKKRARGEDGDDGSEEEDEDSSEEEDDDDEEEARKVVLC
jgi:hypothetical protein